MERRFSVWAGTRKINGVMMKVMGRRERGWLERRIEKPLLLVWDARSALFELWEEGM